MCLYTKKDYGNIPVSKIGEVSVKDIICYKVFKVFGDNLYSPYQNKIWVPIVQVVNKFTGSRCTWDHRVHRGLHAWIRKSVAVQDKNSWVGLDRYQVKRMVIPKGTRYVLGEKGDIAALKMKLDDKPKRRDTKKSKRSLVKVRKKK